MSARIICALCLPLLLIHVTVGTADWLWGGYQKTLPNVATSSATDFAVVINTYKRPNMLREAVQHYAQICGPRFGVGQVFVVWAELDVVPPEPSTFLESAGTRGVKTPAEVHMVAVAKDSLNSRFLPIERLRSDAIFMVDDDVRVDCQSLRQGFWAWKASPHSMVGYYPRLAQAPRRRQSVDTVGAEYVYHSWPMVFWKSRLNFILTKAGFVHRRYLTIYSDPSQHPVEILDYVDQHFNCEDVAMSLLVANVTRAETGIPALPVYVEASVSDQGLFGGISTGSGHMSQRSRCLTDLTKVYIQHGWSPPLDRTFALADASWVQHAPGTWWQHRPSNVFEWFALENVFQ
jgi:hypothetical protein